MRLATFVHISDLHFGVIDPSNFDAKAPSIWAKVSHLDGLLGHSYKSLVKLERFFAQLKVSEKDARLIVTGDLTTVGRREEFETADEFLGSTLLPPKGNFVGLGVSNWREMAIPGNHDHWPGHAGIFGGPTRTLAKFFPNLPFITDPPLPLSSGHELRFLWIDTDADVSHHGSQRFFARGSFTSQLTTLAGKLGIPSKNEIRVLCLHHSRSQSGYALQMDGPSRNSLDNFIVAHDVAALLCGHIHQPPQVRTVNVTHLMTSIDYLDAQCGTTTQLSTLPYQWRTILGRRPARPNRWPNSLLVHRLSEEYGKIYWETEVYLEGPQGFRIPSSLPNGNPAVFRMKIWP
jgi:3',5'-cyclic AMP phosphodiesterase CpdA